MIDPNHAINYANKILSAITEGRSLIVVDQDGGIRTIASENISYDLMAILDRPEQFLSGMRERGAEPVILGLYDEIAVPNNTPEVGNDTGNLTEHVQSQLDEMDPDDFTRDQILLLVRIQNLRFSWFRRPFGEPTEVEAIMDSAPITQAVQSSPEGTINRLLLDAAIAVRALSL